ncbi:hypothetical protein [Bradyrhizobium quebecense]|uniref:Uncharacterized protein n=2 Tax=Bradyrhizobium quebecense TaxID=2748629 RepID=A0ACD3V9Y6_9BRAD|nr:hypothetical protein [Bradyrhizobium quebecense]UGY03204.1 hypothetical protein J4P68_0000030 [Bradyrhizobium quebecense]
MAYDWTQVISVFMMAAGFVLVLVGLLAWKRHRRHAESEEVAEQPRPRMPPLPRLLSAERSDQADHGGNI